MTRSVVSNRGGRIRRCLTAGVGIAVLVLVAALGSTGAAAYVGPNCNTITGTADPTVVNGGDQVTVTATIKDCNGNPMSGVGVAFTMESGPCPLSFNPVNATTNSDGVATTLVTVPKGCPCQYSILASAQSLGTSTTLTIRENGCLPFTSADSTIGSPGPSGTGPLSALAITLGLILAALGGAILYLGVRKRSF